MPDLDHHESERIGAAIRSAAEGVEAPPGLRARVAGERLRRPARPHRSRWLLAPALGVVAALVLATVGLLAVAREGDPSLAEAADLALKAPTQPPPRGDPRDERFLRAQVGGVRFPNYRYSTPFSTAGARRDELSGRRALTVVYDLGAKRIGYTIVDGEPLAVPAGARRVTKDGLHLAVLRRDGALVVTWRQGGHTCVLATRTGTLDQLVAWAAWA